MALAWRHFETLTTTSGQAAGLLADGASIETFHGSWPSSLPSPSLSRLALRVVSATGGGSRIALEVAGRAGDQEIEGGIFLTFKDNLVTRQTAYLGVCAAGGHHPPNNVRSAGVGKDATSLAADNFQIARRWLSTLDAGADSDAVLPFFTPDAMVIDAPKPELRGLGAIRQSRDEDVDALVWERHDLRGASGDGDELAIEVSRTALGKEASQLGLAPSRERVALFVTFRDGRIARLRVYRCPSDPREMGVSQ